MIRRIVKLTFKEEHIEDFKQIFEESKHKIVAQDGCFSVDLLQDKNHPYIFFTYSFWEDESYLEQYRHSDLFKATWARTKILFDGKPEAWSTQFISTASTKANS